MSNANGGLDLAIVGCTVVDLIFPRVRRLPGWPTHTEFTRSNLTLLKDPPIVTLGGNGANVAYVASRNGAQAVLYTEIAEDPLGVIAQQWLQAAGCAIRRTGEARATAVNVTATNHRHHRATLFFPGEPVSMPAISHEKRLPRIVLVCGWPHPPWADIAREFRSLRRKGVLVALDTGPILGSAPTVGRLRGVLEHLDLLFTNEFELEAITRSSDQHESLQTLRKSYSGHILLKQGNRGAHWFPMNSLNATRVRGRRVRATNTIGAGDSFNGAFLSEIARGAPFPDALRRANQLAASVVASRRGVLGVEIRANAP